MTEAAPDFCTYLDSRYLTRGLALYRSICRHAPGARLHVLCMDDGAYAVLENLDLQNVHPIRLCDFEAGDEQLQTAKMNRSVVEYYFTCTPSLPLYVLRHNPTIERLFYIDADIWFFSSVQPILDEMGSESVYIVEHRFPDRLGELNDERGRFNVGILGFRNDTLGRGCLQHWRDQCLEWCYDRVEDGRYADQKYLDTWPHEFRAVVSRHLGVNLAPWNKANYTLNEKSGRPFVNNHIVVCYHFSGLRIHTCGLIEPQTPDFGERLQANWLQLIYQPYLNELFQVRRLAPRVSYNDLRFDTPLSLDEVIVRSAHSQFMIRVAGKCVGFPELLLRPLRAIRSWLAQLRRRFRTQSSLDSSIQRPTRA